MSENESNEMKEMMEMLKSQMKETKQESSGWNKKTKSVSADIQSVSIPLSIQTEEGKLRVYLHFDGSVAETPDSLMSLIESLARKGMPLDFWKSKGNWGKKKGWG